MSIKFYRRLNFKVTIGIITTLATILGISTFLLYRYQQEKWVESLRVSTTNLSSIVRSALQYAMLGNHWEMLETTIQNLGQEEGLRSIMIFDKKGTVKFASDPDIVELSVTKKEPTCLVCHRFSPENRAKTIVYTTSSGEKVFRNVNPIINSSECYRCHSKTEKLNGVLIMDFSMVGINQALKDNVERVLVWTLVVIGVMSLVLWLLLNRLVVHRLLAFIKHTDRVGRGELDVVVEDKGADEMATLAHNFNRMADDLKEYIKIKEVRTQKEQLERLVNSIDDGVLVVDRNDRIVAANEAAAEFVGCSRDELVGRPCCPIFGPEDDTPGDCIASKTFKTGTLHKTIKSFRDRKGVERELEFYASPVRDNEGVVQQVVEVLRDITERKDLEAKLVHSERLASLGLLASGVSHEIKNPLASITTCIEGLQRMLKSTHSSLEPEELAKFNKYLALSKKEAERCKVVTDKLLFLSRKSIPSTSVADINLCLEETLSLLDFEARRWRIEVQRSFEPSLPPLKVNESDLREIFFNVVLNAIQAMEGDGGRLTAHTGRKDGYIEVIISDTGHGIATEDMGRIFEPFFTRKPPGKGTGLGLSICENLIKQIGGDISVKSNPGEGAAFIMRFPLFIRSVGVEEKTR